MKKLLVLLTFTFSCSFFTFSFAQNPTYQQKLFYTCKIWGFVKYYHSNVSTCGVNWDSVLLADLPLVKSAVTKNDFNNVLDTMLNAAGPMALTATPPCDTMAPELKRNLNFGWINDTTFLRHDVITILDTINNNFRPHTECWVEINPNPADGWLLFPYDSLMLNQNFATNYPNEWQKLLVFFKHWNIVNYFTFNIYIHDIPWDSTLMQNVLNIDTAINDEAFNVAFQKIVSEMNDSHATALTQDGNSTFPASGYSCIPLVIEYLHPNYVVAKSYAPAITAGDIITSINGLTTQQWEDSLKPYTTASDTSATRAYIAEYMGTGAYNQPMLVDYMDSLNNSKSAVLYCDSIYYKMNPDYFPNDTLAIAHWRYWINCNIGYVNIGHLETTDVTPLYTQLQNASAIIFDVRDYPASFNAWQSLANMMFPTKTANAKFTEPNITYPGTWTWTTQYSGTVGNPTPYNGLVVILMNQTTASQAEYVCQTFGLLPHAIKVGSQTWGADGNTSFYLMGQQYLTGFTTLGWFLPNGDSTQRIGIRPDTTIYPTSTGLRHNRDELLEKALQIASCPLSIPSVNEPKMVVDIYPNPNNGSFTISLNHITTSASQPIIEIYNVLGENVLTETFLTSEANNLINLSNQPNGVYFYRVLSENGALIGEGKVVVEK